MNVTAPRYRRAARPVGRCTASRRSRLVRTLALGAAVGVGVAAPVAGQQVRFAGRPEGSGQQSLARFLETEAYAVWTRDTVLGRDDRLPGNLLVLEAAVRIAGEVDGDVWVVDGDLFLRPSGRIAGDLMVLGGGFYASELGEVAGRTTFRPLERLRVMPEAGGFVVFGAEEPLPALELGPLYGFQLPVYQRVDAVTLGWGATGRALKWPWRPELSLAVRFLTAPATFEGSLRQYWNPSRQLAFGVEASRATRSNDEWIRRQWVNSLFFFLVGEDFRNYFRADRVALGLELRPAAGWLVELKGGWEEARSLEARDVTVVFPPDSVQPNPAIDDGDTYSLRGIASYERRSRGSRTAVSVALEGASAEVGGDFSFLGAEAQLALRRSLGGRHAVELFSIARGDLAGRLPRQRWSAIGGIGTLPTLPILSLRGPRLAFAEAAYAYSLVEAGGFGSADLLVRGSLGSAWDEGASPRFEKAVAVAARLFGLEVGVAVGPDAPGGETKVVAYLDVRYRRGPKVR